MEKEFTIKVKMKDRWIPHFLGMLKTMQILGGIGSSRWVKFFADGDGDFNPKFEWDIDVEPIEVKEKKEKWNGELKTEFDAG